MPNRISGYNATEPLAPVKGTGSGVQVVDKAQSESTGAASAGAPAADQVTLTGSARILQKLSEAVANAPAVNAQKVATVKQAVQSGTYKIDAGRVADKLLQFESGLK